MGWPTAHCRSIELLKHPDTRVVELSDGQIQLYRGGGLLAVYDPRNGVAGDTFGTPNASSEQIAALIAYHALHPNNAFDRGLATDLAAALDGSGASLNAMDAAYLAIMGGPLSGGGTLRLGAQVGTQKCPTCGQFMGDAHICLGAAQQPATSSTRPRGGVVVEDLPADLGANLPPLPAPGAVTAAPQHPPNEVQPINVPLRLALARCVFGILGDDISPDAWYDLTSVVGPGHLADAFPTDSAALTALAPRRLATLVSPQIDDDPLPQECPWRLAGMDGGDLRADWCALMELRPAIG